MICVDSLHINLNRIMLLAIGLWPYQQSRIVRVQLVLFFSILTSFIIFQLTAFVTLEYTSDLVIDILSSTLFFSTLVIKYSSFCINIESVKYLLEELQRIYDGLKDENEINIIKKYGIYAKLYTTIFMLIAMSIVLTSAVHILWPSILNIFSPRNVSRHPSLLLVTEYFIDKERYLYLILLHTHIALIIGWFSMIATGAILVTYLQHVCGMFQIVSYRLEQAMAICNLQTISVHKENCIYKKMICAVDMHRKALKLSDSLISRFNTMFFLLIIVGVICGSLNYFRVFHAVTHGFNIEKILTPMVFISFHFLYMSVGNYIAQDVTDHNHDVFITVYFIQWYLAPLHVQKLVLFLLQKGRKPYQLTCGGIFVGSLETAATREMICVESLHINLNRIMLLVVGLWPYQRSRLVRVQFSILFAILTSFIVFQLTAFMTLKCTLDLVIDVLSSTLFFSIFFIKYSSFSIDIEGVKRLLEELQHIYNQLKDKNEIEILKKYGNYARLYMAAFMLVVMFLTFTSVLYIVCPSILNIFLPINESRRPSLLFVTEYFIDKERYVYLLTLHEHMAFIIGGFSMIATGGIIIVCQQYACGMFRIASYRLEQAMAICNLKNNRENLIYTRLVSAVDMHRKALTLSESSISRFNLTFFFLIIIGVIDGSLNYFRAVSYGFDIKKLIAPVIFILMHFTYLSISCYIAQEITDYNNDVFITLYSVQWYLAPLHTQKMILFMLQKSRNAFYLICGGIFVGSLETAATILSTSISYFTVIYSTRQ